jgi:hypothetical protein
MQRRVSNAAAVVCTAAAEAVEAPAAMVAGASAPAAAASAGVIAFDAGAAAVCMPRDSAGWPPSLAATIAVVAASGRAGGAPVVAAAAAPVVVALVTHAGSVAAREPLTTTILRCPFGGEIGASGRDGCTPGMDGLLGRLLLVLLHSLLLPVSMVCSLPLLPQLSACLLLTPVVSVLTQPHASGFGK